MYNMPGINPGSNGENWGNYEKDKTVIERVTGNIEQNLKNMQEQDERDLVSKIQEELQAIKNNIENPDNLRDKWDALSLRQVEGAKAYLGTVEQKDISGQYTMCVMAVQTLLQDMRYLQDRGGNQAGTEWIDGLYGDRSGINKTKDAIKDFQKERNANNPRERINTNGTIDHKTIQALLKKKEKTDTEQQTTEQEKNKEKLNKVATMTFQELIEEGLTNENAIMNLAKNAGENNYQIPTSVKNNLKIIDYINKEDINDDIENLNINQDTSRATMKQIKEITEAIEAACGKQGKNLLDQISKIQASTIRAKADANYNKIWNILKERNGKLSEYKDQRINAITINNLKQDFIILKDALNRKNYDAKGNPIDKTKPYFTDKKDVDTYCTNNPQQVVSNLKKLAQAEKAPKIKQKEENGKTEEKSLNLRWRNFIRSNKPQSEELIIQCFNDTTSGEQLDENKILYEEQNPTQISRGESNGDNIRDDTQGNTHEQEDQNQNNPEREVEDETQPTQEEETEDTSKEDQEDTEKEQKKSELQNLIDTIKESKIDDEVGDPATAYKSALEEANNTLQNPESTKENYESAKTTLQEKKNAYETAYQTEKETALEELKTVLNEINIYTVDQNIDSEGEYLQAITTANNIHKETASLQEIKQAKKELEEAQKAYEEAKKQAEENAETEKWKGFKMSADKKTLERYEGNGGEVQIPDGVEHISDDAFKNQEGITKITLPNTLQTIGRRAFDGCTKLQEIIIPDSIQTIGYLAFQNTGINSITLKRSVQYIDATINQTAFKNENDVAKNLFGGNSEKITITFQD